MQKPRGHYEVEIQREPAVTPRTSNSVNVVGLRKLQLRALNLAAVPLKPVRAAGVGGGGRGGHLDSPWVSSFISPRDRRRHIRRGGGWNDVKVYADDEQQRNGGYGKQPRTRNYEYVKQKAQKDGQTIRVNGIQKLPITTRKSIVCIANRRMLSKFISHLLQST